MLQRYASEERSVIPLSLPTSLVRRLNDLAMQRSTNRSALIRDAVNALYFAEEDNQQPCDGAVTSMEENNE